MSTLIRRIRSGEVDLKPGDKDGWYQYQVYALETMLLPTRGQERDKLLLTASYKKRLVEAFKALITKRRETHVRESKVAKRRPAPLLRGRMQSPAAAADRALPDVLPPHRPGLRLSAEPLLATAGKDRLAKLHGLKEGGTARPTWPTSWRRSGCGSMGST